METEYPELTLLLNRRDAGGYYLELRFMQPGSQGEVDPAAGQELVVAFDQSALDTAPSAQEYGRKLAASLFAPPGVRTAFAQAQAVAESLGKPLRVRLQAAPDARQVHALHWETLYDPDGKGPLFDGEKILFSRYLSSASWGAVHLRPKRELRALVVVANPSDLDVYTLNPVDVAGEVQRARESLGEIQADVLASQSSASTMHPAGQPAGAPSEHVTLDAITALLRQKEHDILYIVSHGRTHKEESFLLLENAQGEAERVTGSDLVDQLQKLDRLPVLVALIACQSAGDATSPALSALGPRLAEAGVPAVLAMQGKISMETAAKFSPVFFHELANEGILDRAAAVARNAVRAQPDYWMPALFTRLKTSLIFGEEPREQIVSRQVGRLNRSLLIGLGALLLVLLALGIGGFHMLRPDPIPKTMSNDQNFNVAIAEFEVLDEDNKPIQSPEGLKLADFMYKGLAGSFQTLAPTIQAEVWRPQYTGKIEGASAETRRDNAEARARHVLADVLVYGVIKRDGEQWRFTPEFFVDYKGFKVNAPEIAGTNQFGGPLNITLPFQSKDAQAGGNPRLVGRSQALGLITLGLAHFAFEDFDRARDYFTQALATEGWQDQDGKEVAYLLRGNALSMQASVQKTQQGVAEALADYEQALKIKPNYGRALLGKGGAIYQQAFHDPAQGPTADNLDQDVLLQAEDIFQQVLALTDQPPNADLPSKAHFALGQAYAAQAEFDDQLYEKARPEFQQVVAEYQRQIAAKPEEPSAIESIAGHAYARLGLLSVLDGAYFEAEDFYRQAIQLVGPTYKAIYAANLGEVLAIHSQSAEEEGNLDTARAKLKEAIAAYNQGIDLAGSANVDGQVMIQRFTARLAELEDLLTSLQ